MSIASSLSTAKSPSTALSSAAGTSKGSQLSTTEPNTAVERTQALSSFIDNQATLNDTKPFFSRTTTATMLRQNDRDSMKVENVAARPVFMSFVKWSGTDSIGTIIGGINVPLSLLQTSAIKHEKLGRYQYFSGDIVVRVTASAMAFQAGRLWLSYEAARLYRGARAAGGSVISTTSLDGLEFDPTIPTPMEFRIPFFGPLSEWATIGEFGLGTLTVSVLSPLNSASTATDVTLSFQGWFENVTFGVPTQRAMIPVVSPPAMERPFLQGYKEKDEAENKHVVSDTLDTVAAVAGVMGEIPMLSAIARPVSWGTSLAARAARMFGFSKPNVSHAPTRMEIFPQSTASYMDGSSDAVTLTATSNFDIPMGPVFGSDVDEMDISYICSRMVNIAAYNWDTTLQPGSPLLSIPVMPGISQPTNPAGSVSYNTYQPTPMAFVASMFKYWAGSIKFRFEAVSTPFHAGRLLICYVPDYDPFGFFNINEAGSNYNITWDITTSSHIEFEVPYLSNVPYLETFIDGPDLPYLKNGETSGFGFRDRLRRLSNGAIVVFVLESLVAPATASNTIQILPWIGGGKDIAFAEPTLSEFCVSSGRDRTSLEGKFYDGATMIQPNVAAPALRTIEEDEEEPPPPYERPIRQSGPGPEAKIGPSSSGLSMNSIESVLGKVITTTNHIPAPEPGVDQNMRGSAQNDMNFETWMPAKYLDPMDRAKLVSGECITNLRLLTRRMSPAYVIMPLNATAAGTLAHAPPTNHHVLCFDLDYFSTRVAFGDDAIYHRPFGGIGVGTNPWLYETPTFLSYISYLYTYVRGTRRFLVTSRPSAVINGAPFTTGTQRFVDSTMDGAHRPTGEFDIRVSAVVSNDAYTHAPWFRPEESLVAYNFANNSFATIGDNYTYGLGSLYSSDSYVKRIGSDGTCLEVSTNPASTYPIRLLSDPAEAPIDWNISQRGGFPRKRRFLEIRYRPQTTSPKEDTSNFQPIYWPIPTTISEAAGDDMSYGYLQNPPRITRIAKVHVFMNPNGTTLRL